MISGLLFAALAYGLGVQWIEQRWAWGAEQLAILLLAAAWLAAYVFGAARIRWEWALLPLIGAAAVGSAQLLFQTTVDRWQTSEQMLIWLSWSAAFWVALQILADDTARVRFFRLCGYLAILLAVLAILHRSTSGGKVFWWFDVGRPMVEGVFPYENQYAAFILLSLPAVLWESFSSPKNRSLWILGAAVMVGSVLSSSSVAGAVLVTIEAIAVVCWVGPARGRSGVALLALAVVIGTISGWKDMARDLERRNPLELRRLLLTATIDIARERPLTGWGLGTWTEVYPSRATFDDGVFDNAAHNDWAQWTSEGGLPMLTCMAAFFAMLLRRAWRSPLAWGLLLTLAYDFIEFHFSARPAFGCLFFAYAAAVFLNVDNPARPGGNSSNPIR